MIEYGFQLKDGIISAHPKNSEAVKKIHDVYLETGSIYKVLEYLNNSPIYFSPSGNKKWNRAAVRKILGNPLYAGNEFYPRLVSDSILEEVNNQFRIKNQKILTGKKNWQISEFLAENCYCNDCKKQMDIHTKTTRKKKWIEARCNCGRKVSMEFIEQAYATLVNGLRENPDLIEVEVSNREINSFDFQVLKQKIQEKKKQDSYSNFDLIRLLKDQAELGYSLSQIEDQEYKSMLIEKLIVYSESIDLIKSYPQVIDKTLILGEKSVLFILTNKQKFEISDDEEGGE